MKKKAMIAVVFVGVLFAGLCFLSSNPIISCKIDIPESYSEAIEAQAKGVYSRRLPLIPVCATVDSFSGNEVHYTCLLYTSIGKTASHRKRANFVRSRGTAAQACCRMARRRNDGVSAKFAFTAHVFLCGAGQNGAFSFHQALHILRDRRCKV